MNSDTNSDVSSGLRVLESQDIDSDFTSLFSEILLRHLPVQYGSQVPDNVDLMKLGLDSISAVALLLDLEDAFGITFPQSMINVELYESWSALKHSVLTQMQNQRPEQSRPKA